VVSCRPPCLLWYDHPTNLCRTAPVSFTHCSGPNIFLRISFSNSFLQMGRYRNIGRILRNTSDVLHCVRSENVPSKNFIYYTALLYLYYHTFIMLFFRDCFLCSFNAQSPDRVCSKLFSIQSKHFNLIWKHSKMINVNNTVILKANYLYLK